MYILHHARITFVSRTLCNAHRRHVRSTTTLLCPSWPKDSVGYFLIRRQTSLFRDDFKLFIGNSENCRVSRRHFSSGPVPRLVEMDTLVCALLPKLLDSKPASFRRHARPSTSPTQQVFCCTAKPVVDKMFRSSHDLAAATADFFSATSLHAAAALALSVCCTLKDLAALFRLPCLALCIARTRLLFPSSAIALRTTLSSRSPTMTEHYTCPTPLPGTFSRSSP